MAAIGVGARISHYQLTAKLGEGGMGEVYRATDSRLGREVAIKVLPASFAGDPERLARFEREAKLLAQLHHPHIASIFGLEEFDGTRALILELVEGPTLAERLSAARGPLPVEEVVAIARQIAEALEEAHEHGIVHRDLKPQNVKLTVAGDPEARVKVLDFGLAKAMDPAAGRAGASSGAPSTSPTRLAQSPTLTLGATQLGVILGTAAYMAPEQAKGLAVDKRADVWAFGVVLYEMLTGHRLFAGDTVPDTLAGVLRAEIDLSHLPATTPAALRRLLGRCLERNPRNRLRDIGEARLALADRSALDPGREAGVPDETSGRRREADRSRRRERIAWTLAALSSFGLVGWLALDARHGDMGSDGATHGATPTRSHLLPPEGKRFAAVDGPLTLSPDGTSVVFRLEEPNGDNRLAVRSLASFAVRPLPGTEGTYEPFWSPDGRSIGFFGTHLQRIDAAGLQPPQELAPVRDGRGGSWSRDGFILFAPDPAGVIHRVDAAMGDPSAAVAEPSTVTTLDRDRREIAHLRPAVLPDGRHFVYLIKSEVPDNEGIYVGSLDGRVKKRLLAVPLAPRFAPPDHLLVLQSGRLVAHRLDLERLEIIGAPVAVAEDVEYEARFEALLASASETGRIVYHPAHSVELRQTVRIDRGGRRLSTLGDPGDVNLDLSPDGKRLAVSRIDPQTRRPFIWVHDLSRDTRQRLPGETPASGPVWSPDGRSIAYASGGSTEPRVAIRPADGGPERVVWRHPLLVEPVDWSPDGSRLLVEVASPGQRTDLLLVDADGSGRAEPFAATAAEENSGRFSADGRFVAYVSTESGRNEVYIEPVPRNGTRWLASQRGGNAPRWRRDGRELFFVEPGARESDGVLMAQQVTPGADGNLTLGAAVSLGPVPSTDLEAAPDGLQFFVAEPVRQAVAPPPVLIDDWLAPLPPQAAPAG